jgi:type II secretory pathway component GspD/PulD (secretin)
LKEIYEAKKVPLLGDIPLLGYLFKSTSKKRHKTNLLIMLTPYIIKDQRDLQAIHDRKLRERTMAKRNSRRVRHPRGTYWLQRFASVPVLET